jgi:hypothetical protein
MRKIVDLVVDEISLVDNPANMGARILLRKVDNPANVVGAGILLRNLLRKGGKKLEDLEGADFVREYERRAVAEPDFSGFDRARAINEYGKRNPELRRLYDTALATARARDANFKRATPLDQLLKLVAPGDSLEDFRLRAELRELDHGPGCDAIYEEQLAAALEGAAPGTSNGDAIAKYYKAKPEQWDRYRAAGRRVTKDHEGFVIRLYDVELAPIVKRLVLENLPAREANAIAWKSIPGLHNARQHAIARAKRGATVAQLEAGHGARCEMVRKLEAVVMGRKVNQAQWVSFEKALEDTLAGDVGLRRELAGPGEEGEGA